ncbi:MAG: GNAT family N-acetyltransferase [Candidatus Omnitrophica bacterium]|nr:GNAT family N-acetyltransferase [Candidatus Omnitrophota bacterium]
MSQLRPHIKQEDFLARIRHQEKTGYNMAFIEDENEVVCTAGFRFVETLAWGKFLYVDDLVTDEKKRSKGYGDKMMDWLFEYARENKCQEFHLDSGVQRFFAHRFYFRKGMTISCYHFQQML